MNAVAGTERAHWFQHSWKWSACGIAAVACCLASRGAPLVTRLTPPSALFSYNDPEPPHIARFLPGQRFDLQASVRPDSGRTITKVEFLIDDVTVPGAVTFAPATADWVTPGTMVATLRATSRSTPGVRTLSVRATQDDGAVATARGSFEIVALTTGSGTKARNVILMIGDGMGIGHRTAARVMLHGISQGKALAPLVMETFPNTALVRTASLNSVVTDSAPGASAYSTGNKSDYGHVGVFPDDTKDRFDNPRVELIGEYLARTQGKWLGIVTTADVSDATPSAFAAHAQDRQPATGIVDGYLDEAVPRANLCVLLGGGRRWFLPDSTPGAARSADLDAVLSAEMASAWNVPAGRLDPARDLLSDFRTAGFAYASTRAELNALPEGTRHLLGLFTMGNMNAAMDRIYKRRGRSTVVDDFGFPDQPMLDEMTSAALTVLKQNAAGFFLLVEGGLIDKQAHTMDTARWLHEVIEFDRAVARAKAFAVAVPDTLVIVTADHETGGVNMIGSSRVAQADLKSRAAEGGGIARMRDEVVAAGPAGFPNYTVLADGFPDTADVNRRMIIGYGANADRYEDWQTQPRPTGAPNPAGYPVTPLERATAGGFLVTGQVPGTLATHTGSDVPLSAMGVGTGMFNGVMDNTDVFFKVMQIATSGATAVDADGREMKALANASSTSQRTAAERLSNVSSRGLIGMGAEALVNGFVLTGTRPRWLLLRGVGPSLALQGMANALRDPAIVVRDSGGVNLATNDNWETNDNVLGLREATTLVGAFTLAAGSKDAALLIELPPGTYTVQLIGIDGGTGVGLLEIYELP